MKVKLIKHKGEKLVRFWCPGCGQFHVSDASLWNGDYDNPTLELPPPPEGEWIAGTLLRFDRCECIVVNGYLKWSLESKHQLAGKTLPMQHEEAWRDGGEKWDEVKPPDGSKPEIKV